MTYISMIILSPLFGIIGGIIYRFRGGWPPIPRPIEQALFCSIFLVILMLNAAPLGHSLVAFSLATVATLKGHGRNMDLGTYDKPADPEWYEFLIEGYHGKIPEYWYDVIGITISGLTITAIAGLTLSFFSPAAGLILGLSGASKGPAYMIGWALHPKYDNGKAKINLGEFSLATAIGWGEFLFGFFVWAISGALIIWG